MSKRGWDGQYTPQYEVPSGAYLGKDESVGDRYVLRGGFLIWGLLDGRKEVIWARGGKVASMPGRRENREGDTGGMVDDIEFEVSEDLFIEVGLFGEQWAVELRKQLIAREDDRGTFSLGISDDGMAEIFWDGVCGLLSLARDEGDVNLQILFKGEEVEVITGWVHAREGDRELDLPQLGDLLKSSSEALAGEGFTGQLVNFGKQKQN